MVAMKSPNMCSGWVGTRAVFQHTVSCRCPCVSKAMQMQLVDTAKSQLPHKSMDTNQWKVMKGEGSYRRQRRPTQRCSARSRGRHPVHEPEWSVFTNGGTLLVIGNPVWTVLDFWISCTHGGQFAPLARRTPEPITELPCDDERGDATKRHPQGGTTSEGGELRGGRRK